MGHRDARQRKQAAKTRKKVASFLFSAIMAVSMMCPNGLTQAMATENAKNAAQAEVQAESASTQSDDTTTQAADATEQDTTTEDAAATDEDTIASDEAVSDETTTKEEAVEPDDKVTDADDEVTIAAEDEAATDVSSATDDATTTEKIAATTDEASTSAATVTASSIVAQADATAQATGVHFTKLEIRKGSPTGDVVCDLLTDTAPSLERGQEYYLNVEVTKDSASDDAWVSINLPWWTTPGNMLGGNTWTTPGSSVTSTAIDKVVNYTASTGASAAATTTAGQVWYHIKNTAPEAVKVAAFSVSFTPNGAYYDCDTTDGQTWTGANSISFSTGDMNGEAVGGTTETVSTSTATVTGTGGFGYGSTKWAACGLNDAQASSRQMWLSSTATAVWTEIQFDATYPTEATVGDITYGGVTATKGTAIVNGNGTTTVHCTVSAPAGSVGTGLAATASFPTAGENKTMNVTNVTAKVWGDETSFTPTSSTSLVWNVYDGQPSIGLSGQDITRYDWYGQEGVTADTLVGVGRLKANGASSASTNSQTLKVDYDSENLDVRMISLPIYTDHGTTVKINGTAYNLSDVATTISETGHYAVIKASDVGVDEIKSAEIEIGKMDGQADTGGVGDDRMFAVTLSAWGIFTKGVVATNTYTIYETGTDPTDANNTTLITADGKATPTNVKNIIYGNDGSSMSTKSLIAGETLHYSTGDNFVSPWVNGSFPSTSFDADRVWYLTVPAGFSVSNVTLGGKTAELTDVTSTASNVPDGMVIYRVEWPEGVIRETGDYSADGKGYEADLAFDLTVSPTMPVGTYSIGSIATLATDPDASVTATYSGFYGMSTSKDTYNLNKGQNVVVPSQTFTVQDYVGMYVSNSMQITSSGKPLDTWLTYSDADPSNTTGYVWGDTAAEYKVSIENKSAAAADDVSVYIPVPKVGQDFGAAFTPSGAQEFNLTFTADSVPDGYTVHYLKMNEGVSYAVGEYPSTSDYTEVTDPADADMILITGSNAMGVGATTDVTFKVTSPDNLNDFLDKTNTWGCEVVYSAGGTVINPSTTFNERLYVPKSIPFTGTILTKTVSGTGFADKTFDFSVAAGTATYSDGSTGTSPLPTKDGAEVSTGSATFTEEGSKDVDFGDFAFTQPGTYTYTVAETTKSGDGWTCDTTPKTVTFTVTSGDGGALSVEVAPVVLANTYKAAPVTATDLVTKTVSGSGFAARDFHFTLAEADSDTDKATIEDSDGTVSFDAAGTKTVSFGNVTFDKVGTYHFTAVETDEDAPSWSMDNDATGKDVTVEVTDDGNGQLVASVAKAEFTNTYTPVVLTYDGNGATSGSAPADPTDYVSGATVTVADNTGASADPADPYFKDRYNFAGWNTKADGTGTAYAADATFDITADTTLYAQWTTNGVIWSAAEGSAILTKTVTGIGFSSTTFGFTITPVGDAPAPRDADGKVVTSGTATFTAAGSKDVDLGTLYIHDAGTYQYTVTETTASGNGWTCDNTAKTITIVVSGPSDALVVDSITKAEVANSYQAAPVTIDPPVSKVVSGDTPESASTFTFQMKGATATTPMPTDATGDTVTRTLEGAGTVEMGYISYSAAGVYEYDVNEIAGTDSAYAYDGSVFHMSVTVVDDGMGKLVATRSFTKDGATADSMTFDNVYTTPSSTDVTVTKSVDKTTVSADDTLTYTLTATNNGTTASDGVWIKDFVPDNTTYVSVADGGAYGYNPATDQDYVTWYLADGLAAGESKSVSFTVKVNECQDGTGIDNVAYYEVTPTKPDVNDTSATPTGTTNKVTSTVSAASAKPAISSTSTHLPKTGDATSAGTLALVAAAGLCAIAISIRRRREER